jgi:hypothetical protein
MYTRLTMGLWAALAALGLSALEGNAANITAKAAKSDAKAIAKASANVQHQSTLANVLHELHHAKHLLDVGLHDYHGHRAKADGEIYHAIQILEHHHHAHKKGATTAAKTPAVKTAATVAAAPRHHGPISGETQAASDQKLRHAEKLVRSSIHQLHHLHMQNKEHHHAEKAAHLLKEAVHQIEEALHVVHHYHKHQQAAAGVAK